jgi:hypothetical protein
MFHHFHQRWTAALSDGLNSGVLPSGYFAMIEQQIRGPIPDLLALELSPKTADARDEQGGLAVATRPPRAQLTRRTEAETYAAKANRLTVRHRHGNIVAVIEIVSPGNKSSTAAFRAFVAKSADLIHQGIHLLVIDLFPPGKRDPYGIHKAIWDEFLELPQGKPLTLASYDAGAERGAYVNFAAIGDDLPEMPIFLKPEVYVPVPLDATYQEAWRNFPKALKGLLE